MNQKIFYVYGMLVPFVYIFLYILGGKLRPSYNHISDSVSELLSPGSPNKTLLDILNLTFAILYILFGIGVLQFVRGSEYNALVGRIGAGMIIWMICDKRLEMQANGYQRTTTMDRATRFDQYFGNGRCAHRGQIYTQRVRLRH